MPAPNITIFFEGMILLFFADKNVETGTASSCQVGILRNAPGHIYEIKVLKMGAAPELTMYEEEDIRFSLSLKVEGAAQPGINFQGWDKVIDRLHGTGERDSFRWALDIERELYPDMAGGIGADRKRFRSILRLNNGTFFTKVISDNALLTCDQDANPTGVIGKVATRLGVNITLDAAGKATFLNGKEKIFEAAAVDQYIVSVNRTRPLSEHSAVGDHHETHAASRHNRDADFFYDAIGQEVASKVYFMSTVLPSGALLGGVPPVGPEAACLVGTMSESEI
jgi:hypothetical protein